MKIPPPTDTLRGRLRAPDAVEAVRRAIDEARGRCAFDVIVGIHVTQIGLALGQLGIPAAWEYTLEVRSATDVEKAEQRAEDRSEPI